MNAFERLIFLQVFQHHSVENDYYHYPNHSEGCAIEQIKKEISYRKSDVQVG
jgi:hypothetical protein